MSKRYSAAQKHFNKLAERLQKEVAATRKECALLSREIEKLKAENERLLEYTELSQADIKKEVAGLIGMFRQFSNLI